MKRTASSVIASCAILMAATGQAAETTNYTYDAKGRLVQVAHAGTVNNGIQVTYTHDKADNRTNVTTTGAATTAPS